MTLQDVLELDDRRVGLVAALAQPALQQLVRELALRLGHRLDRQPVARERLVGNEVPAQALIGVEGEGRLLPLLRRQRGQETVRRGRHRRRRALRRQNGAGREQRRSSPHRDEVRGVTYVIMS